MYDFEAVEAPPSWLDEGTWRRWTPLGCARRADELDAKASAFEQAENSDARDEALDLRIEALREDRRVQILEQIVLEHGRLGLETAYRLAEGRPFRIVPGLVTAVAGVLSRPEG